MPNELDAERAPHEHPLAVVPLELVVVLDRDRSIRLLAVGRAPILTDGRGSGRIAGVNWPDDRLRGGTPAAAARLGHFALQFAVWFGFYGVYQVARGAADHGGVADAFWNGTLVIEAENKLHALIEPGIQDFVERSELLITATSYTYWLSQFAVVGLALLWVYFRHHERFADFRNWLIAANLVGLVGYVLMPTAPPRMFPEWGFSDTLAEYASVNHESGLVAFTANPYAAMPSLHAMDALIVGIVMASVCRSLGRARPVARLARLGLLRGHGDRQPLLARLRRRLRSSRFSSPCSCSAAAAPRPHGRAA